MNSPAIKDPGIIGKNAYWQYRQITKWGNFILFFEMENNILAVWNLLSQYKVIAHNARPSVQIILPRKCIAMGRSVCGNRDKLFPHEVQIVEDIVGQPMTACLNQSQQPHNEG